MKRDCACPRARHQHGSHITYRTHGCRCAPCTAAATRTKAQWRKRSILARNTGGLTVDGTGTRRRMQALAALGWTGPQLGERLGVPAGEIARMQRWTRPVYAVTAARVAAVYDDLAMRRPAPWTWVEERCARIARDRNGWLPPLAYDDDEIDDPSARPYVGTVHGDDMDKAHLIDAVAVAEAVAGRRVGLTVQERRQAVHQLTQQGLSAREIGERLGVTGRAVVRGRSAA